MISLKKRAKPKILIEKESNWTQELLSYVHSGQKVPDTVKGRYRHADIKKELLQETSNKCVYCECKITHIDYGHIEHIEPKSEVPHKTYEWENLTVGCTICNVNKGTYYNPNLSLINPYIDNPEEEIKFLGPLIIPKPGSNRANITVRTLKLNRPDLYERRQEHIKNRIMPLVELYMNTTDDMLRQEVYKDILKMNENDQEFSSMTMHVLYNIAITG